VRKGIRGTAGNERKGAEMLHGKEAVEYVYEAIKAMDKEVRK